jgi:hypothetical protein
LAFLATMLISTYTHAPKNIKKVDCQTQPQEDILERMQTLLPSGIVL